VTAQYLSEEAQNSRVRSGLVAGILLQMTW